MSFSNSAFNYGYIPNPACKKLAHDELLNFDDLVLNNTGDDTPMANTECLATKSEVAKGPKIADLKATAAKTGPKLGGSGDEENKSPIVSKNKRSDVALKRGIRQVWKYFHHLFKRHNPSLVRRRLCNLKNCMIFKGIQRSLETVLPQKSISKNLIKYVVGICMLKPQDKFKFEESLVKDIDTFITCAQSYSYSKLKLLLKSDNFRALCSGMDQSALPSELAQELN